VTVFSRFVTKTKGPDPAAPPPVAVEPVLATDSAGARASGPAADGAPVTAEPANFLVSQKFLDAKVRLHRKLIDELNLSSLEKIPAAELRSQRARADRAAAQGRRSPTSSINTHKQVYVERFGKLVPTRIALQGRGPPSADHQQDRLRRRPARRRILADLVDARLPTARASTWRSGRSRSTAPLISIRKFSKQAVLHGAAGRDRPMPIARPQMAAPLKAAARITMLISGGTGSGKTTMLNALSSFIDARGAADHHRGRGRTAAAAAARGALETRPPNIEGKGEIRQRELVKNALRMRPDRIIVGEVRGEEAFDMLQAMNTGHEGSMTTIHANTPRDALARLEQMVGMAGMPMTPRCRKSTSSCAPAWARTGRSSGTIGPRGCGRSS
jgi:pilus assembly protein CpaF